MTEVRVEVYALRSRRSEKVRVSTLLLFSFARTGPRNSMEKSAKHQALTVS